LATTRRRRRRVVACGGAGRAAPSSLRKISVAPPSDVGVANVEAIDEFATATIVAASSIAPFILSVVRIVVYVSYSFLQTRDLPTFQSQKSHSKIKSLNGEN
jgi:ABC-type microcin C transport system permease subunit YejB